MSELPSPAQTAKKKPPAQTAKKNTHTAHAHPPKQNKKRKTIGRVGCVFFFFFCCLGGAHAPAQTTPEKPKQQKRPDQKNQHSYPDTPQPRKLLTMRNICEVVPGRLASLRGFFLEGLIDFQAMMIQRLLKGLDRNEYLQPFGVESRTRSLSLEAHRCYTCLPARLVHAHGTLNTS